tara:strand:+ start:985 stop:1512 length:528 start_codon:yes stop_codon:yes gene_type:complete
MDIINTKIKDVLLLKPSVYNDTRGYFFESYNQNFLSKNNFNINFVQDNESKSNFGVLRGIHFQNTPFEQSKLIRVIKGVIQDVAIDLRPSSKTYKKYVSIILDDKNKEQLFIPKGFGHAFLTLSNTAIISYKVDNFYNQDADGGIKYDDPSINISWELNKNQIILSDKDNKLPYL